MKVSEILSGARYEGGKDGIMVREVLGRHASAIGHIIVDYVRVPGHAPQSCSLMAFARWAKRKVTS
jgi:hypothetical protein